jgi:hypothetical protein
MSKVTITKTELYVEIQVDTSTYLFNHEQYDELWHTMRQDENYASDVLWTSAVTKDVVDEFYASDLADDLNDYVADTCMMYAKGEEENT